MATPRKKKPEAKYVTEEKFNALQDSIGQLVDVVKGLVNKPTEPAPAPSGTVAILEPKVETPLEKDIREASEDVVPVNPAWERKAKEIIGEAVDHCEVAYPKKGGVLFTVVIKKEFSNAPKDYLERMKVDRRTREIGNEGVEGIEAWCKLIKQNLGKPRQYVS